MSTSEVPEDRLRRLVLEPDLCVRSGVYTAIDPSLTMTLNADGEYDYHGLARSADGSLERILRISAFGEPPFNETDFANSAFPPTSGTNKHPVIGNYRGLFAGFPTEGDYRELGSSGGVATWLLVELLRTGRIDGVIHMAPTLHGEGLFGYRVSHSEDEIRGGSKTRYYPGQMGDALVEIKRLGGRYAITAIPSFAYEIRLLQHELPEYKKLIPYVIGLIAGHQKTANYALNLAWQLGAEPERVESVEFRKKIPTRPANRYATEVTFRTDDGRLQTVSGLQGVLFGSDWGHGMFKSNFSDFTEDALNETADVVLGDAWLPRYKVDSRGTNLIITRNQELDDLIKAASAAGRLHLEVLSEAEVIQSQSGVVRQNYDELPYRFRYIAQRGGYVPAQRRTNTADIPLPRKLVQVARVLSTAAAPVAWAAARSAGDYDSFRVAMRPHIKRYRWAQRLVSWKSWPTKALVKLKKKLS